MPSTLNAADIRYFKWIRAKSKLYPRRHGQEKNVTNEVILRSLSVECSIIKFWRIFPCSFGTKIFRPGIKSLLKMEKTRFLSFLCGRIASRPVMLVRNCVLLVKEVFNAVLPKKAHFSWPISCSVSLAVVLYQFQKRLKLRIEIVNRLESRIFQLPRTF